MTHGSETPIPLAAGERPPVPGAVKVEVLSDGVRRRHSAQTKARKAALDLLFEAEVREQDLLEVLHEAHRASEVRPFTEELVRGVHAHLAELDQRISESASGDWTLERMPRIDRALARIAIWEMDYGSTPTNAVIAEAVTLAEEFSTDYSARFLNGLLASANRATKQAATPRPESS